MTQRPILIVDDDFAVREVVQQVLALEGFVVIEAATGRAGMHAWEQHDGLAMDTLEFIENRVNLSHAKL
jgi:CheY-like chemotaxis protein